MPRIHLRLYSTVMRAHGLDEAQMVMLFPMSLSGAAQRWFASLEERVGGFETEAGGVSHFIYLPLEGEDFTDYRPSFREDQISMIMRSLQPRFARHLMGFPYGFWIFGGQRSGDVGAISSAGMRPSRRYQTVGQTPGPPAPYTRPRAPQTTTYVQRPPRQFAQLGMPLSRAFQKLTEGGLLTPLASRPLPQPIPPRFRMDLHYSCTIQFDPGRGTIPVDSSYTLSYRMSGYFCPFTLWPEDDDSEGEIQIVTRSGRIAQPPPPAVRPFEGTASHEEVRREDDEVLRQLQSTQARISIWSLLASSSTHRDALIRALSQIRVETTTTPEGLIHMMTAGRATCIVFSDDDLPPDGLDHVRPLYITVGCSGRRVPSVLLDNGSALNVCPLATAIALGFAPSDFGPSTQTVRAYDSTKREVMGTLMIDLQIGPATFSTLFQKVKFIHDGQVITVQSTRDMLASSEPVLQISHSEDDLFLTGFTFDEIQTLEIEDFHRDFVAMSFDQHSSTVVLDMMRGMTFLPGMGLGRRQQGPSEFIAAIDHDTTFGLGFIPTEAITVTWRGCARRGGSETRPRLEEIDSVVHTDRETELQHLFHQLHCSHDEYRDEMDMMTVSQITSIVQLQPVSAFDMFGVSTIEVFEGTQTLPVPELPEDDSSLFEGIVSPVEGASDLVDPPLSFDVLSGFVSRSDDVSVASFMDLSIFYSDRDSFDHDSGPIDERVSPAAGDVETVDFGTEDQPRELKIGSPLSTDERDRLIHLLRSYLDVFAWSYEDMPGLDPSIVQHHLPTLPHARPVKQKLRRLHPRWSLQVKEEIQKQLSVGFISVVEYPEWLANVVPVPKKDGKVRVCVDFRDLNKASPKDDFPLPHIDLLVDGTAGHSMLSFMDGFSGYNQILMAPEDMEKTAFITEWGTYCYRVMPFGLKNAGATYQRAATTLFHDMMHRDVEVYVDDMIVKSRGRADHLDALERFFERIRKFRLRLNPKKCTFGVTSGKLLGHILTDICEPIFRLLRKNQPTVWNDDCQFAFEKIKEYLLSPPVLVPPTPGRPLLLYLSVSDMALGCMLAQIDDLGKERAIYYLKFDIQYVSQKSIKGSIVADHLASLPTSEDRPVDDDFPDEEFVAMTSLSGWCMYFDGAANQSGYGIGVLLVSPQGDHIPRSTDSGDWKTRDVKLRPYHAYLELLVARFDDLRYVHLPRAQNRFADALATLASSVDIPIDVVIRPLLIESRSGTYPEVATAKDRRALRNLATRFVICGDTLYRRSADGMLLLCLDRASADRVMREVHSGVCGPHMGGHMLAQCQIHGDLIHAPPSELHALTSPWPFSVWDYFTKWVEAASYARLTSARVASFIRSHIICRYGVPHELISIEGHFRAEVDTLLQEYGIRHHRSSAYRPQTNGAVEAANKNIKRILRKMELRLTLVYGMEAVLPVETEMGSLRVALEQQISETEWAQARFDQLNLLDERRLRAADHVQAYQRKMARAFKKRSLDHCKKGT
ncbi:Transposon Ty3-I Gag-Pol polyprotein [Vitis vinifera]|uniref:Transposon Ty3-I Gag-Pol polyprotein n=1 Tax=Vitis vinifera TaxID=29760 RepID=A0A438FQK8_VITVI|nr:Transposon Ty3-I Gag-Pol polyprotein [Vitis vinifera]